MIQAKNKTKKTKRIFFFRTKFNNSGKSPIGDTHYGNPTGTFGPTGPLAPASPRGPGDP